MSTEQILLARLGIILMAMIGGFWLLELLRCIERVKIDLRERLLEPVKIRHRFFASFAWAHYFEVTYTDFAGDVHKGRCRVSWNRRIVNWEPTNPLRIDEFVVIQKTDRQVTRSSYDRARE